MKRIGVISDAHGDFFAVKVCVEMAGKVDSWVHLGDVVSDASYLASITGMPVYSVRGNCDAGAAVESELIITVDGVRIMLVHGHMHGIDYPGVSAAVHYAEEKQCSVLLYGHTHVPDVSMYGGVLAVNPGSPSRPRNGHKPSFAMLEIEDGKVKPKIVAIK